MSVPALDLREVWLSFRGMTVLEDVNLTIESGEFLGLIGPNGGGKSVLLKVILGLIHPDRGTVRVLGKAPRRAWGEVAYVPQHAHFDRRFPMRVLDVVLTGRLATRMLGRRFTAADREKAWESLRRVDMADDASRQVGKLSGGQLQRVLIARALAVEAPVLLLDEPTASLDAWMGAERYGLLDELAGSRTLVLVSHDIGVMSSHVQSVACLNRRLHYHHDREITQEMIEETYGCPVDFVVHEHAHRVLGPSTQERDG